MKIKPTLSSRKKLFLVTDALNYSLGVYKGSIKHDFLQNGKSSRVLFQVQCKTHPKTYVVKHEKPQRRERTVNSFENLKEEIAKNKLVYLEKYNLPSEGLEQKYGNT